MILSGVLLSLSTSLKSARRDGEMKSNVTEKRVIQVFLVHTIVVLA